MLTTTVQISPGKDGEKLYPETEEILGVIYVAARRVRNRSTDEKVPGFQDSISSRSTNCPDDIMGVTSFSRRDFFLIIAARQVGINLSFSMISYAFSN